MVGLWEIVLQVIEMNQQRFPTLCSCAVGIRWDRPILVLVEVLYSWIDVAIVVLTFRTVIICLIVLSRPFCQ